MARVAGVSEAGAGKGAGKGKGEDVFDTPIGGDAPLILLASMPDQHLRRAYARRNLDGRVPYEFVSCVNGLVWSEEDVEAHMTPALRDRRRETLAQGKTWLASGAIAAAITHRDDMVGRIARDGRPMIAAEDDIQFRADALEALARPETIEALARLGGVVLLHYASNKVIEAERAAVARFGRYGVHRVVSDHVMSGAAYFMAPEAARKHQSGQTPLRFPIDHWGEMRAAGVISEIYAVHPAPAFLAPLPTTVNYGGGASWLGARLGVLVRRLNRLQLAWRGKMRTRIGKWR